MYRLPDHTHFSRVLALTSRGQQIPFKLPLGSHSRKAEVGTETLVQNKYWHGPVLAGIWRMSLTVYPVTWGSINWLRMQMQTFGLGLEFVAAAWKFGRLCRTWSNISARLDITLPLWNSAQEWWSISRVRQGRYVCLAIPSQATYFLPHIGVPQLWKQLE